ncbi:MAG: hypothetical protein QNJ90_14475 [Planctomycetota bacterium]|nr:hypothetical protein [Planctomycetota bacterium]
MVIAIIAVVAVVGVIIATSGKKKKAREEYVSDELTADSNIPDQPDRPQRPQRPPPPEISDEIVMMAKRVVEEMEEDRAKGNTLYDEGMAAKDKGDLDLWKQKLEEASGYFLNIRDRWNEVEGAIDEALPMGTQWGADEVANHWLGTEAGKVNKALEPLAYIKKQLGVR